VTNTIDISNNIYGNCTVMNKFCETVANLLCKLRSKHDPKTAISCIKVFVTPGIYGSAFLTDCHSPLFQSQPLKFDMT